VGGAHVSFVPAENARKETKEEKRKTPLVEEK